MTTHAVADVHRIVNADHCARDTSDGVPFAVAPDVPTTVAMPAPMTTRSTRWPAVKTEPGALRVIAPALERVTTLPASPATRVYVVPVCALMACAVDAWSAVSARAPCAAVA